MRNKFKQLFTLALFASTCQIASAYDFEVDGIYYNITSSSEKTVEVTCKSYYLSNENAYVEAITIPQTVTYNGIVYSVKSIGSNAFKSCISLTSVNMAYCQSVGESAFQDCSSLECVGDLSSCTSIGNFAFCNCYSLITIGDVPICSSIGYTAFENCRSLQTIDLPSCTIIPSNLFSGCSSLTSFTIPANVTSIGDGAFSGCSGIKTLIIEDGTEELQLGYQYDNGSYRGLFYNCPLETLHVGRELKSSYGVFEDQTHLTSVEFSDAITSISSYEFKGCSALQSIDLSACTSIGESAFSDCSSLTSVDLSSCSSVGQSAFSNCSSLRSVDGTSTLTAIDNHVFFGCNSLKNVNLSSCTSIGRYAFYNCSSLENIGSLPVCTSIGSYAFNGCSSLASFTIPAGVSIIENYTFTGCSGLKNLIIEDCEQELNLGKSVINFIQGCEQFHDCPLETIYMGRTLVSEYGPFRNQNNLTKVEISNFVKRIGDATFSGCEAFTLFGDLSSCTSIGSSAFYGLKTLTHVDLSACTSIGSTAFNGCTSLTDIGELSACTSIGYAAFSGCNLTNIGDMPVCNSIGESAFQGCSALTSVGDMPVCTSIGDYAFNSCSSLSNVGNLTACKSIGNYAFSIYTYDQSGKSSLKAIGDLPACLSIGERAFYGCSTMTSIGDLSACTNIGYAAFSGCSSLESIGNLSACKCIEEYAFNGCTSLTCVGNLSVCTSIGNEAFHYCSSLTSIGDLSACTSIGNSAFAGCNSMPRLTISSEAVAELVSVESISGVTTVLVPNNHLEDYKNADNWKELSSRIIAIGSEPAVEQIVTMRDNTSGLYAAIGEENLASVIELKVIGDINSYDIGIIRNKMPNLHYLDLSQARIRANEYQYYGNYCTSDDILGDYMFYQQPKLLKVVLPDNITSIGRDAFCHCTNLLEVNIPQNASQIGLAAFAGCNALKNIFIPTNVTNILDEAFYSCYNLQSVKFAPNSKLKEFGNTVFAYCTQLKSLEMPASVSVIGGRTFEYCSNLEELYLPTSLTSIGNNSFGGCMNLRKVYVSAPLAKNVTIGDETFDVMTRNQGTLYVPFDEETGWDVTFYSYFWDTQWGSFLNIAKWRPEYDRFPINDDYDQDSGTIPGDEIDGLFGLEAGYILGENAYQMFKDLHIKSDGSDGGSIIVKGGNNLVISELIHEIEVLGKKWYFFCFPFDIKIEEVNCGDAQYVFRKYDGEERAKGKSGWKNLDSEEKTLVAGVGYIFQANQDGLLALPVDNPNFADCESPQLVAHTANSNADASWNFVGNPYLSYYQLEDLDFDAPVTYWNGNSYEAVRAGDDDYAITPYQAFFVQKSSDSQEVGFDADKQMTSNQTQKVMAAARERRARQRINPYRLLINVTITDGENTDRTRVVYNNEKSAAYEAECDAAKFMSTESVPQLYTVMGGVQYAINERPQGEVSLGYKAVKAGTYSIAMARMDTPMLLKDLKTGETFDFTIGQAYTFNSEAGTFNDRFVLVQNSAINRIENMTVADAETPAFYNLAGQRTNGEGDAIQIMMQGENAKKVMIR